MIRFLIVCFIYAIGAASVLLCLTDTCRYRLRLWIYLFFAILIISIVKLSAENHPPIYMVFFPAIYFVIGWIIRKTLKFGILRIIMLFFWAMILGILGDLAALGILRYCFRITDYPSWNSVGGVLATVCSNGIQVLLVCGWLLWKRKRHNREWGRGLRLFFPFLLFHALCLLWGNLIPEMLHQTIWPMSYIFAVIQFLQMGSIWWILFQEARDTESRQLKKEIEQQKRKNHQFYLYYKEWNKNERQLRKLHHDFKNHMNTVSILLEHGDSARAADILDFVERSLLRSGRDDQENMQ